MRTVNVHLDLSHANIVSTLRRTNLTMTAEAIIVEIGKRCGVALVDVDGRILRWKLRDLVVDRLIYVVNAPTKKTPATYRATGT